MLCFPQRCLRPDLPSLGHSVHGLYQGGLEPSRDGSLILKSIYVGVCGMSTVCLPGFPALIPECLGKSPWPLDSVVLSSLPATLHPIPCLKAVDDMFMVLPKDLVLTSDTMREDLDMGQGWLLD